MDNQTLLLLAAAGAVGIYLYTKNPSPAPPNQKPQYSSVVFNPDMTGGLGQNWQQYSSICMKGALWDTDMGTSFCSSGTVCVNPGDADKRWYCTDAAPEGSLMIA
jgi:hypothetical protein